MEPFLNMTQRVELFFSVTQRVEFFWNTTHRIEFFFGMWLKELNPFFSTSPKELNPLHKRTQRIGLFSKKILKELNFLKIFLTPRIDFFLWLERWNFFNLNPRIKPFFQLLLKNDWPFFSNMTHRIEPFL